MTDDTVALQKGLSSIQDGSTFYFPSGTYLVSSPLEVLGPARGVHFIGDGSTSIFLWRGHPGGSIFLVNGLAYSGFTGFVLDGGGIAANGILHNSDRRFETELRHQGLVFKNFPNAGFSVDPSHKLASAEVMFDGCVFENCGDGIGFFQFNDYNYTVNDCIFNKCNIGIHCRHGNFYIRNCQFFHDKLADIAGSPEHGCSVRRCHSVGSMKFLDFEALVAPITVQDCLVSQWISKEGAIVLDSSPSIILDCRFLDGPANSDPVRVRNKASNIVSFGNIFNSGLPWPGLNNLEKTLPFASNEKTKQPLSSFLRRVHPIVVPGRVFDAKADFGAKADGSTDDTAAVQLCIDAARKQGAGALAYLPRGRYAISRTIEIYGGKYHVGGCGWGTSLIWKGPERGILVSVLSPQDITLENMCVGSADSGPMGNDIDIEQKGNTHASFIKYDGIYVFGMFQKMDGVKGLVLKGLSEKEIVLIPYFQGNLRISQSSSATILINCLYEGNLTVDGKSKMNTGFLGVETRVVTLCHFSLCVNNSQSIVVSDYYLEQSDQGFSFQGDPHDSFGIVVIQGAKFHCGTNGVDPNKLHLALDVRGYSGTIFLGPEQFYSVKAPMSISISDNQPFSLILLGNVFYQAQVSVETGQQKACVSILPIARQGEGPVAESTVIPPDIPEKISIAINMLRRLGSLDSKFNTGP